MIKRVYGDEDSKSFPNFHNIYDYLTAKKQEWMGHVKKRVGTRHRELKENVKRIGGKGKLRNAMIDRLQNYYGLAIWQNVCCMEEMKKVIYASLFHVVSSGIHIVPIDHLHGANSKEILPIKLKITTQVKGYLLTL